MSAIFIYGTGASYTCWHERSERQSASHALTERLDIEISYRLSRIFNILRDRESAARLTLQLEGERHSPWIANYLEVIEMASLTGLLPKLASERHLPPEFVKQLSREEFSKALDADIAASRAEEAQHNVEPSLLVNSPTPTYFTSLYPQYSTATLASLLTQLREYLPSVEQHQLDESLKYLTPFEASTAVSAAERLQQHVVLERWRSRFTLPNCPNDSLCLGPKTDLLPPANESIHFDLPKVFLYMAQFHSAIKSAESTSESSKPRHPPPTKR